MSDKPISKGDLVMVVRPMPCCANTAALGDVFTVLKVGVSRTHCRHCGYIHEERVVAYEADHMVVAIERLIRLDPDALKDDIPESEEIKA